MRLRRAAFAVSLSTMVLASFRADAASHPPGVAYPLTPAAVQPAGLAHPLPSTRRYVLVWKDQLVPDGFSGGQKDFVVHHYVGTQKLYARQIDAYRTLNPGFLMLVYHLAYGLNGADQTNPVQNITQPDAFGLEDTDDFTPWLAAHAGTVREDAYQHSATPGTSANRVAYPDPFWLMDVASPTWRSYLVDTLVTWQGYPAAKADGVFFDVAFFPWYDYSPDAWWSGPAGGSSRTALRDWWNARAQGYFQAIRDGMAATSGHPRYLVVPNTDALADSTDEPAFLDGTDGVFTENWQGPITGNANDWNLSTRRIAKYATSAGKVWIADVTRAATDLTQAQREMLIGTYLLIRNGTSYVMFGNADLTWYPEYEIDLGAYASEPPADLEALRVGGAGGGAGGLYARTYARGVVVVNSSTTPLDYTVATAMKRAAWSGGGAVDASGAIPAMTLTYDADVAPGKITVAPSSVVVLRDPAGAPPPGEEPNGGGDAGAPGDADGGHDGGGGIGGGGGGGSDASTVRADSDGGTSAAAPGGSGTSGCACTLGSRSSGGTDAAFGAVASAIAFAVRVRSRRSARARS